MGQSPKMSRAETTPHQPVIAQWIFDTRSWYPEVTQTKQLETYVSTYLHIYLPIYLPIRPPFNPP